MTGRGNYTERDRIEDSPAVQAIIQASERVLPETERNSLSFRPVGKAIVIHGHYAGLEPETEGILLGIVSSEGVPYSIFNRLKRIRSPYEANLEVEDVARWAKQELGRMGFAFRRRLSHLRKIKATLAMRREP